MKALILRQNADAACATSKVLIDKGFQILCVETLAVAHALIRVDTIDLLVMDETFAGQLTHAIALSGERRSPYISTIMLTDRDRAATDDLYDLIPCLYALVGTTTSARLLGQLALAAVSMTANAIARHAEQTLQLAEDMAPEDMHVDEDDDVFAGDPPLADIAIAGPAMAELTGARSYVPRMHLAPVTDPDVAEMLQAQPFAKIVPRRPLVLTEPA